MSVQRLQQDTAARSTLLLTLLLYGVGDSRGLNGCLVLDPRSNLRRTGLLRISRLTTPLETGLWAPRPPNSRPLWVAQQKRASRIRRSEISDKVRLPRPRLHPPVLPSMHRAKLRRANSSRHEMN